MAFRWAEKVSQALRVMDRDSFDGGKERGCFYRIRMGWEGGLMNRRTWIEAGARSLIRSSVRRALPSHEVPEAFDVVLDVARTMGVDDFVGVCKEWRREAERLDHIGIFLLDNRPEDADAGHDKRADAVVLLESVALAEAVIRDFDLAL